MRRRTALLSTLAALGSAAARAQLPEVPVGEIKPLGQERYQIGRIVVDKRAGRFTVPGRVHLKDKPLEYLVTSPGGIKEYEALLEVDASGSEFNLACILVGLERDARQKEALMTGVRPLPGPRVAIWVAWTEGGKRRQVTAAEALLNPEAGLKAEAVEWVYTGSPASDQQPRFAADATGTLVAFKPDANSVIESAESIGLGAYGSVRGHAMLPPVGGAIELIVQPVAPSK
jgi:hypothetical protein